jgi:hypothetical protein
MACRRLQTAAAVALASAGAALAQTFSLCNPTLGQSCPPNPAFGGVAEFDFTTASMNDAFNGFWIPDDGVKYNPKLMSFNGGANFVIYEEANAPQIKSQKYLFFGKVEVVMQAAPGRGIVSSIVLESDDLDEIDWVRDALLYMASIGTLKKKKKKGRNKEEGKKERERKKTFD